MDGFDNGSIADSAWFEARPSGAHLTKWMGYAG
jgi:hypothetical protein